MANATFSSFVHKVQSHEIPNSPYLLGIVVGGVCILVTVISLLSNTGDRVPYQNGMPFVGSWAFFTRRHRFVNEGIQRLGNIFAFNILHVRVLIGTTCFSLTVFLFSQHKVVAVSGEEARKTFFSHKDLDFSEGYQILFGGVGATSQTLSRVTCHHSNAQHERDFVRKDQRRKCERK